MTDWQHTALVIGPESPLRDQVVLLATDVDAATVSWTIEDLTNDAMQDLAWTVAPIVVVLDTVAADLDMERLGRRDSVVLVGNDMDDAGVWARAVRIGAEHVVILPDGHRWLSERLLASRTTRA